MHASIIAKRLTTIRRQLTRNRIDCLIVTSPPNVTYLTGFTGADSWAAVTRNRTYLLTDSRYTEQAAHESHNCLIVERTNSMPHAAADLAARLNSVHTIAVEKSISLAEFQALRKHSTKRLRSVAGIVETARSRKHDAEVSAIKTSASITAAVLRSLLPRIKPGITEIELAGLLDLQARTAGADTSFETIVAFGPNASRPHHRPTRKKLKTTDTILIDFGARYKGYCSDVTRSFALGAPTALYRRAFEVVEHAQAAAISTIKAGVNATTVDSAARDVIRAAGLPVYGHGTGHGFGLEVHEAPFLKPRSKETLQPGHVLTIEPGIYIPGKLGVRIEDDVLVTETGCKVLTRRCPRSMILPR